MTPKDNTFVCYDDLGLCCPAEPASFYITDQKKKPVEIYVFIDPLCPECWSLEPIIKKLQMEYSNFFTLKMILGNELRTLNSPCGKRHHSLVQEMAQSYHETAYRTGMPCDGDVWYENAMTTPYSAILAIKAAELQGKAIGSKYLRRVREALFLHKQNIADEKILISCAKKVIGMDVDEFSKDLHSENATKALQCDVRTTKEMDVDSLPTMVFFSDDVNEPGLKVQGLYDYEIYVDIIADMLGEKPEKCPPISLKRFVAFYSLVAEKEISVVFNMSMEGVHKEMRKLQLQRYVEEIETKHGSLWQYTKLEEKNK